MANSFDKLDLSFGGVFSLRDRASGTYFRLQEETKSIYTDLLPPFRIQHDTFLKKQNTYKNLKIHRLMAGSRTPLLFGRYDLVGAKGDYFLIRLLNGDWLKRTAPDGRPGIYFAASGVEDACTFSIKPTIKHIASDHTGSNEYLVEAPLLVSANLDKSFLHALDIQLMRTYNAAAVLAIDLDIERVLLKTLDADEQASKQKAEYFVLNHAQMHQRWPIIENEIVIDKKFQNTIWSVLFPRHPAITVLEDLSEDENIALQNFCEHIEENSQSLVSSSPSDPINPLNLQEQHVLKASIELGHTLANDMVRDKLLYIVSQRDHVMEYFDRIIDVTSVNFAKYHTIINEVSALLSLKGTETKIELGNFSTKAFSDILSISVAVTVPLAPVNTALSIISVAYNLFLSHLPEEENAPNPHHADNLFKLKLADLLANIRDNFDTIRYQVEDCRTLMCSSLRILESWDKLEIHFPHSTEQLTEGMEKNFKVHAWKSLMPFACKIVQQEVVLESKKMSYKHIPIAQHMFINEASDKLAQYKAKDMSVIAINWHIMQVNPIDSPIPQNSNNFVHFNVKYYVWRLKLNTTSFDTQALSIIRNELGFTDEQIGNDFGIPFVPIAGDETQVLIGPSTLR